MLTAHTPDFEAVDAGGQFRFTGMLRSNELERAYRQHQLAENLSTAALVLAVNAAGVLTFINADNRLFGTAMPFPVLLAVRLGICFLSVITWRKLRAATNDLQPQRFDLALTIWGAVLAGAQFYVSFTRPVSYSGHFLIHLFVVMLVYCALPLPLILQAIPAFLMSIGMVVCMTLKPPADGLTASALLWTLVSGNILGAGISRQLHRSGRLQFLALTRETQARIGLENALAELKILRGIIPICAHCKSIRDDAGAWQQLELYISKHSDAEFSHGICPTCVNKFFP